MIVGRLVRSSGPDAEFTAQLVIRRKANRQRPLESARRVLRSASASQPGRNARISQLEHDQRFVPRTDKTKLI